MPKSRALALARVGNATWGRWGGTTITSAVTPFNWSFSLFTVDKFWSRFEMRAEMGVASSPDKLFGARSLVVSFCSSSSNFVFSVAASLLRSSSASSEARAVPTGRVEASHV